MEIDWKAFRKRMPAIREKMICLSCYIDL